MAQLSLTVSDLDLKDMKHSDITCCMKRPSAEISGPASEQAAEYAGTIRLIVFYSETLSAQHCPMQCGFSAPQPFIPLHTGLRCPLSIITCSNSHVGCTQFVERRSMTEHLRTCAFASSAKGLSETQKELRELTRKTYELSAALKSLPSGPLHMSSYLSSDPKSYALFSEYSQPETLDPKS